MEADSIQLSFGQRRILSDIYIRCNVGEITGLLGRNGEGKTCLMNSIYGTLIAENQSVRFDNVFISHPYQRPDLLSYLPQFNFIPGNLRIRTIFKHFHSCFDKFICFFPEFKDKFKDRIWYLSSGQKRLIEVYLIINAESKFIMLDEPFSYIMPLHVQTLITIIQHKKKEKGFLISDHLFQHVVEISDDIYILSKGKAHLIKSISDIERLGYARLNRN